MQDVYVYKHLGLARQDSKPLASCKAIVLVFSPFLSKPIVTSSTRKVNMNISKPVCFHRCTLLVPFQRTVHWGLVFACHHAAAEVECSPMLASPIGLPVRKTKFSRLLSLVKVISTVWCDFFFFSLVMRKAIAPFDTCALICFQQILGALGSQGRSSGA